LFTNIIIYIYLLFVPKCFQLRSVEETTQAMAFDGIILEVLFTLSLSFLSIEAWSKLPQIRKWQGLLPESGEINNFQKSLGKLKKCNTTDLIPLETGRIFRSL